MATIREKSKGQWQVQIRRKGWPFQSGTFRTRKEAQAWARKTESEMDRGLFVDQTAARETTLADLIQAYIDGVTENRHSENARVSERLRLERFLRAEKELCSYYIINLRPEHFEAYRERRLKQKVLRELPRTEEPDIAFGLCDLGMGCPELGSVSISELVTVRGRLGLPIERDRHFIARQTLSAYARDAHENGRITV